MLLNGGVEFPFSTEKLLGWQVIIVSSSGDDDVDDDDVEIRVIVLQRESQRIYQKEGRRGGDLLLLSPF